MNTAASPVTQDEGLETIWRILRTTSDPVSRGILAMLFKQSLETDVTYPPDMTHYTERVNYADASTQVFPDEDTPYQCIQKLAKRLHDDPHSYPLLEAEIKKHAAWLWPNGQTNTVVMPTHWPHEYNGVQPHIPLTPHETLAYLDVSPEVAEMARMLWEKYEDPKPSSKGSIWVKFVREVMGCIANGQNCTIQSPPFPPGETNQCTITVRTIPFEVETTCSNGADSTLPAKTNAKHQKHASTGRDKTISGRIYTEPIPLVFVELAKGMYDRLPMLRPNVGYSSPPGNVRVNPSLLRQNVGYLSPPGNVGVNPSLLRPTVGYSSPYKNAHSTVSYVSRPPITTNAELLREVVLRSPPWYGSR